MNNELLAAKLQRLDDTLNRSCRGLHGDHVDDIMEKRNGVKKNYAFGLQTRDLIFIA